MLNLDAHVLVPAVAGSSTPREKQLLSDDSWSISAIVLWEIAKLVQLGRLEMDLEDPDVVRTLGAVRVWPLDLAVARQSTRLDSRSDPADEIIAATSVVHNVPLLTRGRIIRRSKLVPIA